MKRFLIESQDPDWCPSRPHIDVGKLFSRIPNDVVLSVTARDLQLRDPESCLCGWAVREMLAKTAGIDPDKNGATDHGAFEYADDRCANLFGGRKSSWNAVFNGVTDGRLPTIEAAWVDRLDKAVRRA